MNAHAIKFRVRYQETDRMGVVYHSNYLVWFEMGRTEFFRNIGISYSGLESEGYRLVVVEVSCRYKTPATYDEEIEVVTRLAEFKNATVEFDYEVRKGGGVIATGHTKHAFTDANGRIAKMPSSVYAALQKLI